MAHDNDEEILYKKAEQFYLLKRKVHITLQDGIWKRGIILEIKPSFLILDETLEGEIPIFFQEMIKIDGYKKEIK